MKYLNEELERKSCEGCTACCHVMSIPEIQKPFKQNCIHQCNGCLIYAERPQPCIDFECLWLQGWAGGEQHRPSRCGIMYTGFKDNQGEIISAWELWPGAFRIIDNLDMLKEVSKLDVIIMRHFDGKISFRGKPAAVRQFLLLRGQSYLHTGYGS